MPDITAYGPTFRGWESLIGNLNVNGHLVPGHEPLKAELAAALEAAKELKVQQESLEGNRVAATDRFLRQVDDGKERARKLRSFIVSVLGPRSPYLKLFGINPKPVPNINPKRKRQAKPETPTQPPAKPPAPEGQTAKPSDPAKPAA